MANAVSNKIWPGATLQSRRWLVEQRLEAVEQNNVANLQQLLDLDTAHKSKELTKHLEVAILKKSDSYHHCVRILLARGASPCGVNGVGTPFLLIAAEAGCIGVVNLLLQAGCAVNQTREDGATALHRAVWNDHIDVVKLLLDANADCNAQDGQCRTPGILAAQANRCNVLRLLASANCDLNMKDVKGRSALYWSARYGNSEITEYLLQCGADINSQDVELNTALMLTAERGHLEALEVLLDHDADVDYLNVYKKSAILMAAERQHGECVQMLAYAESDVNIQDEFGTPLIYMVHDAETVAYLLEVGADPDLQTSHHVTAIWFATVSNHATSVKLLLQANCRMDEQVGYEEQELPLLTAISNGYQTVVQLLCTAMVAMMHPTSWLRDYLQSNHYQIMLQQNAQAQPIKTWLEEQLDVIELSGAPSLQNWCRAVIRRTMGNISIIEKIESLSIPTTMKGFLALKELDDIC